MRDCGFCELPIIGGRGGRMYHEDCKLLTVNLPRKCKKCRKVKHANEFSRDASRAEGRFPYCKTCQVKTTASFQNEGAPLNGYLCPLDDTPIRGHANRRFCSAPCKERVGNLRTLYGLEVCDYRRLVEATGGHCPICGCRPTSWHVEHNHQTRLVTGVTCANCNVGILAYSNHDLVLLAAALAYLTNTPAQRLGIVAMAPEGMATKSNMHKTWSRKK